MVARKLSVLVCMVLYASVSIVAEEQKTTGKIDSVTLYRGQALVTRVVPVTLKAGATQLVITGLPERIQPDSLYAGAQAGVQIRAVRYRTQVVREAPRAEVRDLDQKLAETDKKLRELKSQEAVFQYQARYLGSLEGFVAPTTKTELKSGVLNAKTLQDLTLFLFEERKKQAADLFALTENQRTVQATLDELRAKRAQLTRVQSKIEREAVVFLDKAAPGATTVRLSYLVGGATWAPGYNIQAAADKDKVAVEYNAVIQQMSGEDWDGVKVVLSTASPKLVSDAPELAPLHVTLASRTPGRGGLVLQRELKAAQSNINRAEQQRQRSANFDENVDAQWEMNAYSGQAQVMEYNVKEVPGSAWAELRRQQASMLSVNYALDGRTNVASRSDQQIVRIADLSLPATLVNVAAPLLTENVYREAHVVNDGKIALLEGESSAYLDGDFVGRGSVPMVARGQRFVVGFGIDPQLRAWREFISRKEEQQGGNRILTFRYRLVLDNYKTKAVTVRAFDRIPTSQEDIKTTLGEMKDALSADKEYLRAFRPNGILRWDVQVPAGSAADTARIVEYSFTLEFDRNMDIRSLFSGEKADKAKKMFREQMMERR